MSEIAAPVTSSNSLLAFHRKMLRDKPLGGVGGIIFALFLFCGLFADFLAPYGMNETDMRRVLEAPSLAHWMGTDHIGRDVFSRILYGAQLSVIIGFLAAGLATLISIVLGVLTGYFGGKADMLIQRFVDAWMTFPDLVVLIVVVSIIGAGEVPIIIILGCLYGIAGSRIIRGSTIAVRENMYTHAAQSMGANTLHIIWFHVLPNVMPVVIVLFTTRVGAVILAEAGLSFLGLGIPPPVPTWGSMLSGGGRTYMYVGPWLALAPGLALTVVVYAINVYGDALRDMLDPRMGGR